MRGHRATVIFAALPWADDGIFNQHSKHSKPDAGSNEQLGDRAPEPDSESNHVAPRDGRLPPDDWPFVSRKLDVRFIPDRHFVPAVLIGDTPYFRLSQSLVADFAQAIEKLPDSTERRKALIILADLRVWLDCYPDQHAEQSRGANLVAYLAQIRAELKRTMIMASSSTTKNPCANGSGFIDLLKSEPPS